MFDFDKIAQAMEGVGELDALLRSILAEQRTTNMLLGVLITQNYEATPGDLIMADRIVQNTANIANGPDART